MTGFGVDIGQLGSIAGKVSEIGDSLNGVAGTMQEPPGGDFGHPQLNQVISQASGMFGQYISALGQHAGGMAGNLQTAIQGYAGSDGTNTEHIESVFGPGGGSAPGFPGGGPGTSGDPNSGSNGDGSGGTWASPSPVTGSGGSGSGGSGSGDPGSGSNPLGPTGAPSGSSGGIEVGIGPLSGGVEYGDGGVSGHVNYDGPDPSFGSNPLDA